MYTFMSDVKIHLLEQKNCFSMYHHVGRKKKTEIEILPTVVDFTYSNLEMSICHFGNNNFIT